MGSTQRRCERSAGAAAVSQEGRYTVTIEVRGPQDAWEDISLAADRDLDLHTASLCYRLRLTEQHARAVDWGAG